MSKIIFSFLSFAATFILSLVSQQRLACILLVMTFLYLFITAAKIHYLRFLTISLSTLFIAYSFEFLSVQSFAVFLIRFIAFLDLSLFCEVYLSHIMDYRRLVQFQRNSKKQLHN